MGNNSLSHGLSDDHLKIIRDILSRFFDRIDRVALFGSRAMGAHRPNSDVDMVLYGSLDAAMTDRIWTLFDESSLPFRVDVVSYALIEKEALRAHIDEHRAMLLEKSDILPC